jgi:hypothetical protein
LVITKPSRRVELGSAIEAVLIGMGIADAVDAKDPIVEGRGSEELDEGSEESLESVNEELLEELPDDSVKTKVRKGTKK